MSETSLRIKELKDALGLSSAELARLAGLDRSTLSKVERGERNLTQQVARKLAPALQVPVSELYASPGTPTVAVHTAGPEFESIVSSLRAEPSNVRHAPQAPPMPDVGGVRDLPVFGTAAGGIDAADNVQFDQNMSAVEYITRPPALRSVPSAFAGYLSGDSMADRFKSGDLIYINPNRPVRPGDYVLCVFADHDPKNIRHAAYFKRLVRRTAHKVVFEQTNPPETFEVGLEEIKSLWRVYDWSELLSGM